MSVANYQTLALQIISKVFGDGIKKKPYESERSGISVPLYHKYLNLCQQKKLDHARLAKLVLSNNRFRFQNSLIYNIVLESYTKQMKPHLQQSSLSPTFSGERLMRIDRRKKTV